MPVINDDGTVGFFYWEPGLPDHIESCGIDRSCTLFTRPVFDDGSVGDITRKPITFGEMVAHQAALKTIKDHQYRKV